MKTIIKLIKTYPNLLFIGFFIVTASILHHSSYNKLPSKKHGWAQGDHYVLALGFLNNDFDFFHPETFSLTHQFPPKKELSNPKGITAVDFPILHYTVAIFMKIFNTTQPWVFRFVMLLLSFIALFYLFRTIKKIKGFWESLFICSFIMFQPIYAYYQNGFHVSSAAFNMFLIGLTFMVNYVFSNKKNYFIYSILFLTIASLMRFTQIIFLIAIGCVFVINIIKNKKIDYKILYPIIGLTIVLAYFVYNKYVANTYGSVFLNKPKFTYGLKNYLNQFLRQIIKYFRGFLPFVHLTLLSLLYYYYKINVKINLKNTQFLLNWLKFALLGVIIFNIIMSWSVNAHDYYSLDTWLPVLSIILLIMVLSTDYSINFKNAFVIIAIVGMFSNAVENQHWKYKSLNYDTDKIVNDFKNSSKFLNKYYKKDKKTLVIASNGWNTPMIGWHKKVYRLAKDFKKELPLIDKNKYDFIITHNKTFDKIIKPYLTNFNTIYHKVDDNNLVTIWKIKK